MQTSRKYKPLPIQPDRAPSDLNRPSNAGNAAKRAKRHARYEDSRNPDQRLMDRTDLGIRGRKIYTFRWLKSMDSVMRLWCEFFRTKLNDDSGPEYFKTQGPLPDELLVHRFLFWVADSALGTVYSSSHTPSNVTQTTRVTVGTVDRYIAVLASAFSYFNRRLDADLIVSSRLWVKNNLARDLELNREVKEKPIAYTTDVSQLIKSIWKFESIAVFKNIRAMFNVTLVLNSLVDGASRIGEFIPKDIDSVEHQRYMKWKDLEFFLVPSDDVDGVTIYIIVLCKWLKRYTHDSTGHKSFVLRLLPPHLAFSDSCRLLVILALHNGYFRDFSTWEEVLNSRPSPNGNPMLLKSSCLQLPVLSPLCPMLPESHSMDILNKENDPAPWMYNELQRIVNQLSRLAGLAHKTGLHQLRHGDAYLLEQCCKNRETARTMMGQQGDSDAFSTYLSKIAVTDLQAVARNVAPVDLTLFSSLSLGMCENAPVTLPQDQLAAIVHDPEFLDAKEQCDEAEGQCLRQFALLSQCRQAAKNSAVASELFCRYQRANSRKEYHWRRAAELKFRAFRQEAIRELTAARPVSLLLDSSESTVSIAEDYQNLHIDIDDILQGEDFFDSESVEVGHFTAEQAANIMSAMPDDITEGTYADAAFDEALNASVRRHNIFRVSINSMVGTIGRQTTGMSSFSYDYLDLQAKYNMVTSGEFNDSSAVMAMFLDLLSSERHMKDLPPHWVCPNDASKCRVCGERLFRNTGYAHVYACLQNQAKAEALQVWNDYCSTLPAKCTWASTVSKACKTDLSTANPQDRQCHLYKHSLGGNGQTYKCYWDGCKESFTTRAKLTQHAYYTHGWILWTSSIRIYFWCHYCEKAIFEIKSTQKRLSHFESHHDEAIQTIRDYGYSGVFIGQNRYSNRATQFLPAHCIICLHNESMNHEERHINFSTHSDIAVHMGSHFRYLKLGDTMYCPATVVGGATEPLCNYEHAMDPQEAWEHIQDIHYGFKFPDNYAPSGTATGCIRGKRTYPEGEINGDSTKKTMIYKNMKPRVVSSASKLDEKRQKPSLVIAGVGCARKPLQEMSTNERVGDTITQSQKKSESVDVKYKTGSCDDDFDVLIDPALR